MTHLTSGEFLAPPGKYSAAIVKWKPSYEWFKISIGGADPQRDTDTVNMKQILQKRRLTTNSHDLRRLFSLLILTTAISANTLPAFGLTAEDQAEIRDLVNKGNALMSAGRYKEALDEYEAVLRIDPENHYGKANRVLTHNKWALSFFRQQKYKEAKQHWDIAHQLNPNDPTVNQNLKVLEFRLQKLGIDLDAEERAQEEKGAPPGAPKVFDPLRENPNDWSPFGRQGRSQATPGQAQQRPTGGAFNVGGGMPTAQQAQQAPLQQTANPYQGQVTQSGPQLIGGVSGSPSAATSGATVISGGTNDGALSSGPVILNGSASGNPATISSQYSGAPNVNPNQASTFTLSAGTSNSEPAEGDYSAVQIVGGSAPAQGVSEAHEGLPFTESPAPGANSNSGNSVANSSNAPAIGYSGNTAPSYEAANQGRETASSPGGQSNPVGVASSPPVNANPPARSYITGQQAYGAAPVGSVPLNSPMNNSAPNTGYPNNYQPNNYPTNNQASHPAPSYEPARNVNMSFGTTGNVVIPPPANRHGTGTAYKFPTNIVPPRAAPGFLGEAPPAAQTSAPSVTSYSDNSSDSPAPGGADSDDSNSTSKSTAAETSSDDSPATVNKILTEIEKKVYGKTSENLPILKRLERIEVDTLGKKVTGSINDRLNKLKETYGL